MAQKLCNNDLKISRFKSVVLKSVLIYDFEER
jgi:hypothetical protein